MVIIKLKDIIVVIVIYSSDWSFTAAEVNYKIIKVIVMGYSKS